MNETKPKRRWLRFSLRTLLIGITLLCVWMGIQVNAARRQKEAVSALLKAGANLSYDYQWVVDQAINAPFVHKWDYNASPPGPEWMRKFLGEEYFREVIRVYFPHKAVAESDLAQLKNLPAVWSVYFPGTTVLAKGSESRPIGDKDLSVLQGLERLESLLFDDCTEIHGWGIRYIAGLKRLRELRFRNSPIEDVAMEHIGKLSNLEHLELTTGHMTSAGVKYLENLTKLKVLSGIWFSDSDLQYLKSDQLISLSLGNAPVTDIGLAQIARFSKLTELNLGGTKTTDAGAAHLMHLTELTYLTLNNTAITDVGLRCLQPLKKLKQIYLMDIRATPSGFRELKKALPTTQIFIARAPRWQALIEQPPEVNLGTQQNVTTPNR